MKNYFDINRKVFDKVANIKNNTRMNIVWLSGAIETIFSIYVFLKLNIKPMVYISCVGFLILYICLKLAKSGRPFFASFIVTVYAVISITVVSFFANWSLGFQNYLIILIPLSFTFIYSEKRLAATFINALCTFFVVAADYFICLYINRVYMPVNDIDNAFISTVGSINFFLICFIVFLLVAIFVIKLYILHIQMSENAHQLSIYANIDTLTGIYNRRYMYSILEQMIFSQHDFSIIILDIDFFKNINDTYGHNIGDKVLKEISANIATTIRTNDYLCRWGGEEFMAVLPHTIAKDAGLIAQRVVDNIATLNIVVQDKTIHCTITAGVAQHMYTDSLSGTISKADANLYRGKRLGRNCVVV